jgi:WD40 repeat protein
MSRLLAFALLISLVGEAPAQLDRRSRDEPEMFIEAGGRTGTCDVLLFSPDGKHVYAGGDDKVVRVWPVNATGFETGRMRTLRWPAWRDQRGGVKTIALPSDATDRRVAIAGYGLKTGLVCLLDGDGEIIANNDIEGLKLPNATVTASSFTPDNKGIIYGTGDGRLWSWNFGTKNVELGRFTTPEGKAFNRPRMIRFVGEAFIAVSESGQVVTAKREGESWKLDTKLSVIEQFHAALRADKLSSPAVDFKVYRADLSPDGKWLACSLQPNYLVLVPLDGGAAKAVRVDHFVRSLAFDRDGRLAVASAGVNTQSSYRLDTHDVIKIFEKATFAHCTEIKHRGRAEAMAWGPDGLLAVAGGDNHEVTLYDAKETKEAKAGPLSVVRGRGRGLWDVRIGKDGETILYRPQRNPGATDANERGQGNWQAFNFAVGKPVDAGTTVPIRTTADGWKVEPDGRDPMLWHAVKGERRLPLRLNPDLDEQPRCYCFVPAKGEQPTRLLVGHYHGYSLFELTEKGAERIALGTGQGGDVHSIAADADGTWVVTCGADQTVAGWSLADWPSGPFGAKFTVEDGKLMVTAVDVGGPAWEMGLSKGSEIVLAVRGRKEMLFGRAGKYQATTLTGNVGTPTAAREALNAPTSGIEYYLAWKADGKGEVIEGLSTVRRRPLWRFFPAFDANDRVEHWVAWMWKGGHYATSTSGDFLVGWQLNDPETISRKRPEFFLANRFKGQLNKKLAVLRLMQTRDLEASLKDLAGDNPQPPRFGGMEPAPVRLDIKEKMVGGDGLKVDIAVDVRGNNPDLLPERVELWVNDHRFKTWDTERKPVATTLTIPATAFRHGDNDVTVLTFNQAGGRGEAKQTVKSDRSERQARLLGLLVGINDYSQTKKNPDGTREFGNLASANNDAKRMGELWKAHAGKDRLYADDKLVVSLDPKAYRKDILAALDSLATEATADDCVVIFLAGHGDFVPKPGAPKGSDEKLFVFCCPNYSREKWEETGVTAEVLFDRLARCPARKLVLLDACHSGQAASESIVRQMVPEGQGPMVIAACDQKELSFEHPKIGHGLFTASVLEALGTQLGKADTSKDGKLDAQELFAFVRTRLPELLKETGKPERIQNPQAFPLEPAKFPIAQK